MTNLSFSTVIIFMPVKCCNISFNLKKIVTTTGIHLLGTQFLYKISFKTVKDNIFIFKF